MNKVDSLIPLARVGKGATLSSAGGGDQYYVVESDGSSNKVPLEKACKLYIDASEKGDLLWNRSPKKKRSKSPSSESSSKAWRDELRQKLGYKDDP